MNARRCFHLITALAVGAAAPLWGDTAPAKVGQFNQEVATTYTTAQGLPSNNVAAIGIDSAGVVHVVTDAGLAKFENGAWVVVPEDQRTAVMAITEPPDSISVAPSRFLHEVAIAPEKIPGVVSINAASVGGLWSGTKAEGYYTLQLMTVKDGAGRTWSSAEVGGVTYDSNGRLWFCTPAGIACRLQEDKPELKDKATGAIKQEKQEEKWAFYEGKDGVPYTDFTCAEAGPDGVVWFGTTMGAIRYDEKGFHYREGKLWLPENEVRDIAVDAQGNAWCATPGGVGCIERKPITLWQKAQAYEQDMNKIRRTEYGYVSEVGLKNPGDTSPESIIYSDSDNDGLWTAMYGAGECFGYAATKDPALKANAVKAFEALRFLQTVTQGGSNPAPKGYVARTILPVEGPNPNEGRLERDKKEQAEGDKLWKAYEPRWPTSADGKWYWKSDTSSDELDGHYFFYPQYYDLACETEEEKAAVRQVVVELTDHLIDHGFRLVDHSGTVTRWGEYSPEALNNDPNWWIERGLKSLSMLSYLAVAHHMTGDQKYLDNFNKLAYEHGYLHNAMVAKVSLGVGASNQSDDEMAIMCYYNLLKYLPEPDPAKKAQMKNLLLYSFYSRYALEQPEMNPFFNFAYAAFGPGQTYTSPYGSFPIDPWAGWLDDSIATLTGFPLNRVSWGHLNSQRVDIVSLSKQAVTEPAVPKPDKLIRGLVANTGKVLPVENRYFNHWNTDPFDLDYRENGQTLGSGTVYLLPYYMGLYHGFIEKDS